MIKTEAIAETEVFRVVVTSANKKDAVRIANAVKDVLPETVNDVVNGESSNFESDAAPLVSLQQAEYKGKVKPDEQRCGTVGAVIGAIVAIIAIVIRDVLDTSINTEEYLTDVYGDIPLLAVIPDAENPKSGSGYKGYYESQKKPPVQKKGGTK